MVMHVTAQMTSPNIKGLAMVALQTMRHPPVTEQSDATLALFCRALDEVNRLERRPIGSAVEYVMQTWRPRLDLPALGFADIDALAAEAERQGLIRQVTVSGHRLLQRCAAATPTPDIPDYRAFIERKLRCPLPPTAVRLRIYATTNALLAKRSADRPALSLLDLSYGVATRLGGAAGQHSVFKLLFALILAKALVFIHHEQSHDIRVTAAAVPTEQWDALFVATCLSGLRRDRPAWPLNPLALAQIFGLPRASIDILLVASAPPRPPATVSA